MRRFFNLSAFMLPLVFTQIAGWPQQKQNAAQVPIGRDFKKKEFSKRATEYMERRVKINKFSGAILVASNGELLLNKAYGSANYEYNVPNTHDTKFRIGSVTKMFTAAAILLLEQKGKLKVTDSVGKYLAGWPQAWSAVTIHHLLSHTAGLPPLNPQTVMADISGLSWYRANPPKTIQDLFKPGEELQPLDFKPGEKLAYSNIGYVMLGFIVEKVSGKPYCNFLKEEIFRPLGLNNTGCDDPGLIIKQRASGYSLVHDTLFNASYVDMRFPLGAGALYSTTDDLYKWDTIIASSRFLNETERDKLFTPNKSDYGYGWWIQKRFNQKIYWHRGTVSGFVAFNSYYPEKKLSIVVLSNINAMQVRPIGYDLAAIALGEKYVLPAIHKEIKVDTTLLDSYLGKYSKQDQPDNVFALVREGAKMIVQNPPGTSLFEIFPEGEDNFFAKWGEYYMAFQRDKKGTVTGVIEMNEGERFNWSKVP